MTRIQEIGVELSEAREARHELAKSGAQSISISSQGGSKAVTQYTLSQLTTYIQDLTKELAALRKALGGNSTPFRCIQTIYC